MSGTITDEPGDSKVSSAAYQVMDEYRQTQPSGSFTPEAAGNLGRATATVIVPRN